MVILWDMKNLFVFVLFLTFFGIGCGKNEGPADNNKPFIVVLGSNPLYWEKDKPYEDPGAEAYDITAAGDTVDITSRLQTSGTVDVNTTGKYEIHYNVSDESGNKADEQVRTVYVQIF